MPNQDQITQLQAAIAALEAQQTVLGKAVVAQAIAPLRQQLEQLKASQSDSPPGPSPERASISLSGERRLVTVVFADISGFTAMSEQMDPEQVRSTMNACFNHLVPVIEKYGGTVDKFIGDEIMALFGAPLAHENDPERALRASLEMMDTLDRFNRSHFTDLGIHIGVNTGLAVAGGIGSQGRQQYSVMGDAVNLASRLEEVSARGEIIIGPDTYRFTEPLFEFETLTPVQVKGKVEAVQAYKLLGLKSTPGNLRGVRGLSSPLVGRHHELETLVSLAETVATGPEGRLALIIGEPGLGKSRLTAEWRLKIGQQLHWVEGRCVSHGQALAYHLLIDLGRAIIGVSNISTEAEMRTALHQLTDDLFPPETAAEIYAYIGHLLALNLEATAEARIKQLDPQALQTQYLSAFERLLTALAQQYPLGIILEDIHWADPSSTALLVRLLPLVKQAPILFCCVTRPYRHAVGWQLVSKAQDLRPADLVQLTLNTLSETDSRELIAHLLRVESLPISVRNVILAKAEGNPFFVEEVIRMLIDRGVIVEVDNRWVATQDIETIDIPDSLQGLLLARIDRLPEEAKHTLRVASVLGRQFSARVLAAVLERI